MGAFLKSRINENFESGICEVKLDMHKAHDMAKRIFCGI
jgi:hypothetical protein